MKIHDLQAKDILHKYGVAVPDGDVAFTIEEAETAAHQV
jgi:succinyl-CoA synthetase beta subunit